MRYITKLTVSFSGLLIIALTSAGLAYWSARSAEHHLEQSRLAHRVHQEYLSLSNNIYQLFKKHSDALVSGNFDRQETISPLLDQIRSNITRLRGLIAREIVYGGERKIADLQLLSQVERQFEALLREFAALQSLEDARGSFATKTQEAQALNQKMNAEFRALISQAVEQEEGEVARTEAEMQAAMIRFEWAAIAAGLLAAITSIFGIALLRRALTLPVQRLLKGAEAVGHGDLGHRIPILGNTEFDRVAKSFNDMAEKVEARQGDLNASRDELEREVSARTEQLEKLLEALRRADANRRRLLADVSHELRTPLTIIRGEADVALRAKHQTEEQYRDVLTRTREAADHTSRIVDDLLFVARQEVGEVRIRREEVDLGELLQSAIEASQGLADPNAEISYASNVEQARLSVDPGRVRQVVMILLENARLYGGSQISVRLDDTPNGYAVSVSDNGTGLAEDDLAHVFERFFRGSNAALRYDGGAGLGLPVAKAIVETHGGQIALTSTPGEGVEARFTLPGRAYLAAVPQAAIRS